MRFKFRRTGNCLNKFRTIIFLILAISYIPSSVYAATYYVDKWNGNDRNNGLSTSTAWRAELKTNPEDIVIFIQPDNAVNNFKILTSQVIPSQLYTSSDTIDRIILGLEHTSGWTDFSTDIWKAPAVIESIVMPQVSSDDTYLTMGCADDFLNNNEWHYNGEFLFIRDSDGNPDLTSKVITVKTLNNGELDTTVVSNWLSSQPTVFQLSAQTKPIYLLIDDTFYQDWWWGPRHCYSTTGDENTLYLREPDGNPDITGKKVDAVINSGGWSVSSGNFNGDGFNDVVYSNNTSGVFIDYGKDNFSPVPDNVLKNPEGQLFFAFDVSSAGDVNNDGFDDLLVTMGYGVGEVYLYMGSAAGLSDMPDVVLNPPGSSPETRFQAPRQSGDFNGDGYSDVVILAPPDILFYYGSSSGIHADPDVVISSPDTIFSAPIYIEDINKDGFADLAVAASGTTPGSTPKIHIYHGSAGGIVVNNPLVLDFSLLSWGNFIFTDLNGDGRPDLILSNERANGTFALEGAVYVFYQSSDGGFPSSPNVILSNPQPAENVQFGLTLGAIGDFNYDGFNDLAVGCPYGNSDKGFVAVYYGSAAGISSVPSLVLDGAREFGWALARAGDIETSGRNFIFVGEEFDASYLFALKSPSPTATGSLQVTLLPPGAVAAGAQWKVDGGSWQNSGVTVANLAAGNHTVQFRVVKGWKKPADQITFIYGNGETAASYAYVLDLTPITWLLLSD